MIFLTATIVIIMAGSIFYLFMAANETRKMAIRTADKVYDMECLLIAAGIKHI